jgi:hypothetical protein
MASESYRAPDFSLQHRIDTHEFGKRVASAAFFPMRLSIALMETYVAAWGLATPRKKEEETATIIPISQFASYYERRSQERS